MTESRRGYKCTQCGLVILTGRPSDHDCKLDVERFQREATDAIDALRKRNEELEEVEREKYILAAEVENLKGQVRGGDAIWDSLHDENRRLKEGAHESLEK